MKDINVWTNLGNFLEEKQHSSHYFCLNYNSCNRRKIHEDSVYDNIICKKYPNFCETSLILNLEPKKITTIEEVHELLR
ncbi:MAG: hypothetical protein WC511_00780 [Candidatus Pacearchaeota archaeon]|jgi:hypothetical protein